MMISLKILRVPWVLLFMCYFHGNPVLSQSNTKLQKCIMVFGAHADDVDEIAGGTFARYIAMGYRGIYVSVTNNLAGCNIERTPWVEGPRFTVSDSPFKYPVGGLETNQIRSEEAKAAAAVYGSEPVFLDFCEPEIYLGRKIISHRQKL